MLLRIVVGSLTPIKLEAVEIAASLEGLNASVRGTDSDPRELSQPFGLRTLHGAITRAHEASYEASMHNDWDIAFGVENGLVLEDNGYFDIAYAALLLPDGSGAFARSEAVPVPEDIARKVLAGRQRKTIGELESERSGCDHRNPHSVWTNGRTDRKAILIATIREVLVYAIYKIKVQGGSK